MKCFRLALPLFILSLVGISRISGQEILEQSSPVDSEGQLQSVYNETKVEDVIEEVHLVEKEDDKRDDTIEERGNVTLAEPSGNDAKNQIYTNCVTGKTYGEVELVNATRLMELLIMDPLPQNRTGVNNDTKDGVEGKDGKITPTTCILVLFYARWCVFSSQAAPHFNALARAFPDVKAVAIDASKYQSSFNTQFGIVGVPTLVFVYNGKPLYKFNHTAYNLESFSIFVSGCTSLKPNGSLFVTSADFGGPVPNVPSEETDFCLVLSWIFIAACAVYFTLQSQWWKQFVELIQNTWRESNAQHEHTD